MKTKSNDKDLAWKMSFLAWEAINILEDYCPDQIGDLKTRMEKANDELIENKDNQ
jgi:hypothetical protein